MLKPKQKYQLGAVFTVDGQRFTVVLSEYTERPGEGWSILYRLHGEINFVYKYQEELDEFFYKDSLIRDRVEEDGILQEQVNG